MTPSLYDLLDVDPDADAEQIRAAWRSAIADLDPSDRRFRAYNQAAETLLDPARRREYDRGRGAEETPVGSTRESEPAVEPAVPPVVGAASTRRQKAERRRAEKAEAKARTRAQAGSGEPAEPQDTGKVSGTSGRAFSTTTLVVVGLVTLLVVVAAAFYTWNAVEAAEDQDRVEVIEQAAEQAEAAAEEAAVPLLSYDYRTLQSDVARALPLMTDSRAAEYEGLMEELRPDARKQKIAVVTDVTATGVVRAAEDRAQVLVYLDQTTTKAGRETAPLQMWVTMTMVEEDAGWLVDEMQVDQVLPG